MNQSSKFTRSPEQSYLSWTNCIFLSLSITLSTPTSITTSRLPPLVNFTVFPPSLLMFHQPGNPTEYIIQGTTEDVEIAMQNLQIRSGYQNGEDITVNVTAAALESNPTEEGPDEVAILRVLSVDTLYIPVHPLIEGEPVLTCTLNSTSGNEDSTISLGNLNIRVNGTKDADGSEVPFLEVKISSFPTSTTFYITGANQTGVLVNGGLWLRLNTSEIFSFSFKPPKDFSGNIDFLLRARVIDYTTTGNAEKVSETASLNVKVYPIADVINGPTSYTVGIEDLGPVKFGKTLATTSLRPTDRQGHWSGE